MDGVAKYGRGVAILLFMLSCVYESGPQAVATANKVQTTPVMIIAQGCDRFLEAADDAEAGFGRAACAEIEGGI